MVDDDHIIRELIKKVLEPFEIVTRDFKNSESVIEALGVQDHPDLIFLDVSLEQSDAIDVIRGLADQKFKGVVQLVSGQANSILHNIKAVGERRGLRMRPPLAKPFTIPGIRAVVVEEGLSAPVLSKTPLVLAEALDKGWLELWYRPKIDLRTKMLAGIEGVVRARHPVHGVTSPSAFLKTATEADRAALSEFMILSALMDWAAFREAGFRMRIALKIPPNSVRALMSADLFREIRPKHTEWPGLMIEVNAKDIAQDVGLAHEIATQLSLYDVSMAIDKFHPDDALAKHLGDVPFSELELDKSYVLNCGSEGANRKLCESAINFAHQFGRLAVAKGLENKKDLGALLQLGCDTAQGPLFSPPIPKDKLIPILKARLR